jgi:acid stress chaperone HdeB
LPAALEESVRFLCVTAVAGLLFWGSATLADDIDLTAWSCQKFMSASKEDVGVILAWLDGYYREEDEPPVINTEALVSKARKLGEYCAAHPDISLIDATDKLFQKQ